MNCPKCGGKTGVTDTVHNLNDSETYRRRKCAECGNIFYTTEFDVDFDETYRKNWWEYARDNSKNRKLNKEKNK